LAIAATDKRAQFFDSRTKQGVNSTAPTKGKVMNEISSLRVLPYGAKSADKEPEISKELTIREMARLYDVSLRTLRFYEDRGLLAPRREGNVRFYRAADRARMEMILQGKRLGFTLTEINDLIGGAGANDNADIEMRLPPQQIVSQIGYLERQRAEIDSAIERLRATQGSLSQGAA
jgi:DNA-binding transcriptional MerR regulator